MTAQAYLNVGTAAQNNSAATLTPALFGTRPTGSLLQAVCVSKNNATHSTATAGWVKKDQVFASGFTASLWERKADGTEAAPVFTWTGAAACSARTWIYSRDDESTALTGALSSNFGTGTTHTSPALTTTANNSRVVYVDVCAANTAASAPTGRTERFDAGNATGATRMVVGDSLVTTAGSSSGAASLTGGNAAWIQWQVELLEPVFAGATYLTVADTDDGASYGGPPPFWLHNGNGTLNGDAGGSFYYYAGFRFVNLAIPQGATITSARLVLVANPNWNALTGTDWGDFYGDDVDNAPAWSSSSRPDQITKTTASVPAQGSAVQDTVLRHNVAAIVQEIIDRPGWASGNAIRFGGAVTGANGGSCYFDYFQDVSKAPKLLVEYTTGGGGSTSPITTSCFI